MGLSGRPCCLKDMQGVHRVKGDTVVSCHPCWDGPFNAKRNHVVPGFELSLSFVASGIIP